MVMMKKRVMVVALGVWRERRSGRLVISIVVIEAVSDSGFQP